MNNDNGSSQEAKPDSHTLEGSGSSQPVTEGRSKKHEANLRTEHTVPPNEDPQVPPEQREGWFIQKLKEAGIHDWVMVAATLVIAIATVIYTHYASKQWEEMKTANQVALRSTYAACVSAQIARGALIETQKSVRDAHGVAVATNYQTLISARSDDPVISIEYADEPHVGSDSISVGWNLKNTGKSAIKNGRLWVRAVLLDKAKKPTFNFRKIDGPGRATSLGQDERWNPPSTVEFMSNDNGSKYAPSAKDLEDLQTGQKEILLYGRVTYTETFGVRHWQQFCRAYQTHPINAISKIGNTDCDRYNRSDANNSIPIKLSPDGPETKAPAAIECVPPPSK